VNRAFISAAEPSGDRHAARVALALRAAFPSIELDGVGGEHMALAGVRLLERAERLSAVGAVEALATLPTHVRLLKRLEARFAAIAYDVVILVDYPGFHVRLAGAAGRRPVLYYIAPQLWAWGAWRMGALRARVRHLAVILPFEEPFFSRHGVPCTFVGHPLLDGQRAPSRDAARRLLGLSHDAPVLGVFPGSRRAEVSRLWPAFRDAAADLRSVAPDLRVVVAARPGLEYPRAADCVVWTGDSSVVMAAADAGLCKSGTTTLEAALHDLPMVVAYRLHPLTAAIARRLARVRHIGLVNLVAGREVTPELTQEAVTPGALARAVFPLLDRNSEAARAQREAFADVRSRMGQPGVAERVAALASRLAA
jgi:lipid-A-disaccharide synthase